MKLNIFTKFVIVVVLVGLTIGVAGSFVSIREQEKLTTKLYFDRAVSLARSIDAGISAKDIEDPEVLKPTLFKLLYLNPEIIKITVFKEAEGGTYERFVSTATTFNPEDVDSDQQNNSEAARKNIALSHRHTELEKDVLHLFVPLHVSGRVVGTYKISVSLSELNSSLAKQARNASVYMGIVLGLLSVGAFFFVRIVISHPINKLLHVTHEVEKGKFDVVSDINSKDEMGELASSFHKMAQTLKNSYAELEERVKARTADLEAQKNEVERINKLLIGRELKMAELKKELEALKQKG